MLHNQCSFKVTMHLMDTSGGQLEPLLKVVLDKLCFLGYLAMQCQQSTENTYGQFIKSVEKVKLLFNRYLWLSSTSDMLRNTDI